MPTILAVALAAAAVATAAPARAANPQSYKVELRPTGDGDMDSTLRATSDLVSLRTSAPVSPYGLIARARSDMDRLKTVLESYGYYQSSVAVQIDGDALSAPQLADELTALPKGQDAKVQIRFSLGPLYHLRKITLEGELPPAVKDEFPLKSGAPAVAAAVLGAGDKLRESLGERGYAFAKVDPPVAYEDQAEPLLDVTYHVEAGERVKIGEIRFRGLRRLRERVVRRRLLLHTGEQYNSAAVERARADLLSLGIFASVSVDVGKEPDASGGVPITFRMRERPRHAINVSSAYSTDLGASGTLGWADRNVFGNADQLSVTTQLLNAGGSSTNGIGYDATIKYSLPDFGHRDQTLQLSVGAIKQNLEAYDQTATTAGVTLVRKIDRQWTASAGLSAVNEKIIQVVGLKTQIVPCSANPPPVVCPNPPNTTQVPNPQVFYYTLVQVPLSIAYDSTDLASPLDDPTHGMRDSLTITPTHALGASSATFLIEQVGLASYFDLDHLLPTAPGRSVIAMRALVGVAQGAGEFSLPPDQRFYGGGSSSIRGYPYQAVGPYFPGTIYPIGGTALVAAGIEYRQRFGRSFGGALFADAGQVSDKLNLLPSTPFIGIGTGVRYYTPIGPLRLDVAFPTKHYVSDGQRFQVYIGLGQAF